MFPALIPTLAMLAVLALLGLGGIATTARAQSSEPARADAEEREADIVLWVDGMSCPFCAYGLEKKLSRLESVQQITIDLENGRVRITLKEGESVSDAELEKAVADAGFSLRKLERPGTRARDAQPR